MISLARRSAASSCSAADRFGREIDGAEVVAHVEGNRWEVVELFEGRREHVLSGVLLHVIATAVIVDNATDHVVALQSYGGFGFDPVQHLSGGFVLEHFGDTEPLVAVRKFQPSGIEVLAAARGIEGGTIESHEDAAVADVNPGHGCFEIKECRIGIVKSLGQTDGSLAGEAQFSCMPREYIDLAGDLYRMRMDPEIGLDFE